MTPCRNPLLPILALASLLLLGGRATRPINPPITEADPSSGYRFETRQAHAKDTDNLVILAFFWRRHTAATFRTASSISFESRGRGTERQQDSPAR